MLLTVRINRAKGNHITLRMHELITKVHHEHGIPLDEIGKEIGADKHEVETLMMQDIFEKKQVAENEYQKSWYPKGSNLIQGRELTQGKG